jgi:hypothetical protein
MQVLSWWRGPHEAIHANIFINQLLDYADKHAKVFVISPLSGLLRDQSLTFGVFPGQ